MIPDHEVADWIMDVQAYLQTSLGILRLEMSMLPKDGIQHFNLGFTEDRLELALAKCHKRLDELGIKMDHPCTHPDVWDGPDGI